MRGFDIRQNYFAWKTNQVLKGKIEGIECVFYAGNLEYDGMVLVKYGAIQITTKQAKSDISTAIKLISDLIEGIAIFDERYEKYSTALSVLDAIKSVLFRKYAKPPTIEAAKITIDVMKELALIELKDPLHRTAIKSVAFIAKLMLGVVANDE